MYYLKLTNVLPFQNAVKMIIFSSHKIVYFLSKYLTEENQEKIINNKDNLVFCGCPLLIGYDSFRKRVGLLVSL